MDFAGVMTFTCEIHPLSFSHLVRDPPSGYNRVSVSQLIAADRACWARVIEKRLNRVRPILSWIRTYSKPLNHTKYLLPCFHCQVVLRPVRVAHSPTSRLISQRTCIGKQKGNRKGGFKSGPYAKGKGRRFEPRIPNAIREQDGYRPRR